MMPITACLTPADTSVAGAPARAGSHAIRHERDIQKQLHRNLPKRRNIVFHVAGYLQPTIA
jgi:hypothetical protein